MSLWSVRIATRFCKSSTIQVPRFLSSHFLLPRCNSGLNNLLTSTGTSRFRAICRCSSSVSQSDSRHTENTSRCALYATLDSVVEIFSFYSTPSLLEPWRQKWQGPRYTGGFVISGRRILTNAHVVDYDAYVQVRKHGSSTKYEAIVEAVGFECDLAILVVDNEEFWEDVNPLELGDIPFIGETVSVLGYPVGGDTICVTKGIVSRVEPIKYVHSSTELLTIQTDACIDYGNSGGPVVIGNKVAGIAFQGSTKLDKTDYMIPTPDIKHFLNGVEESGYYIGPSSPDITFQRMENAQMRKHFKMNDEMTGILVNEINPASDAHRILEKMTSFLQLMVFL
ncbi:unnamed protein product [Thlaspi arvense]|uniref:Uncharacterized protein n=1 Tax=Thlaspi arvense TaxID=13288 RepID=A0AAU9SN92_THLAR|nr:unnamed protein product [Thlaspi arvense]